MPDKIGLMGLGPTGTPSPIFGHPGGPILGLTGPTIKIVEKCTFYAWIPHNFGRLTKLDFWVWALRALLHPFLGTQKAQFGVKRVLL